MSYLLLIIKEMCSISEINKYEGFKMSIIIKRAESLFEKFEKGCEIWAEKLF